MNLVGKELVMNNTHKDNIVRKSVNGYISYSAESFISLNRRIWIREGITHDCES